MRAPPDQLYCVTDFETRSEAVLRGKNSVGAFEYGAHKSTEILCAAWRIGTRETLRNEKTHGWCHRIGVSSPDGLHRALRDPKIIIVAQNSFFERVITKFCLGLDLPTERWECTAALLASYAFPRNLAAACDALKLPIKKDPKGKLLIRRHCQPRKPSKDNPSIWNNDPEGLAELFDYCKTDIAAEVGVFLKLPPLPPFEKKLWQLDQDMNFRGIQVDRKAVITIQKLIAEEVTALTKEVKRVTGGVVQAATQRAKSKAWLESIGVELPNMQKKTIEDALKSGEIAGRAKKFLELRQSICKTSTGKYKAFEQRTRFDGRLRDYQLYHGASTGRFTGSGVQVLNLPRPTIKNADTAIEILKSGDLKWARACLVDVMEAASSSLRGMITANPKETLYVVDWAGIEARINFWLARHDEGLKLFEDGRDPYREEASGIYGVKLKDVTEAQREVGKRAFLGLGYQMGWPKFQLTCDQFGTPVEDRLAQRAVESYRKRHKPVVDMWSNLERAAITAVKHPGTVFGLNRVTWVLRGKYLFCILPSGRKLTYYDPVVRYEKTPWGDKRPKLYHWDVNPKTKNWELTGTYGGKLDENICQAISRDLMVRGMLRAEKTGYKIMMTVYDEIVASHKDKGLLKDFENLINVKPKWAEGLPTKVAGFEGFRYRKA